MTTDDTSDASEQPDPEVVEDETTAVELTDSDAAQSADEAPATTPPAPQGSRLARAVAFGLLPILALLLGGAAGYLKWEDSSRRDAERAANESVQAA